MTADQKRDEPELPRDVLAAIAMHALCSNPAMTDSTLLVDIARLSYEQADKMLAARDKS